MQSNDQAYEWRKARGLLVLSDWIRIYRAVRVVRGTHYVPLPDELIWRTPPCASWTGS